MSRGDRGAPLLLPLAMLLFGAGSYAMTLSPNRIAITEGIPVLPFVFWQGVGAAAVSLAAPLVTGQPPRLGRVYLRFCLLFGFVGLFLVNHRPAPSTALRP